MLSKMYLGLFNAIAFVAGLGVMAAGLVLKFDNKVKCLSFLTWWVVGLGVVIVVLSVLGSIGLHKKKQSYLYVYLVLMLIALGFLISIIVLSMVVLGKGGGHSVPDRPYEEYNIQDYSRWLQKRVNASDNWRKVEKCLKSLGICNHVGRTLNTEAKFDNGHLSPIESGCCKPPEACGFNYQNATEWVNPTNPDANGDCKEWTNDQSQLCFDCISCKAGMVQTFKETWLKVTYGLIILAVFQLVAYVASVYQFISMDREKRNDLLHGIPLAPLSNI